MKNKFNFLVDSHCHLVQLAGRGKNIDNIIANARLNGVGIINNVCANIEEMPEVIACTEKYKGVFCSVGHHPDEIQNRKVTLDEIVNYAKLEKIVAIGESGLDYYHNSENKREQIENFELHIEASRQSNLPMIVHTRSADEEMIDVLASEMKNGEFSFVLHSFCSSQKLARAGLDLDGFVSFSGILTFKNSTELRNIAKDIPLNKILIETDSPYLAPEPYRGSINEPAYVGRMAWHLSNITGEDYSNIVSTTTKNFLDLFTKVAISDSESGILMGQEWIKSQDNSWAEWK
ncbi:MAG: TatD family hydrolase [Rickettsiales bacterium]|jgi:TatD DNase family protein|nr:TatD family hydrolase [Rickettsiales bacterium]